MDPEKPSEASQTYCAITIELDDSSGQLWATLTPTTNKNEHTKLSTLQIQLRHPEFGGLEIIKENMAEMGEAYKHHQASTFMIAERPPVEMQLHYHETTGQVEAICHKCQKQHQLTLADIKQELAKYNYDRFYLIEENCQLLINAINARKVEKFIIAEKRHAEMTLTISDDKKTASIKVGPAHGGEAATLQRLKKLLHEKQIHGVMDDSQLTPRLLLAETEAQIIAKATEPVNGQDSQFIYHVADSDIHPKLREDGTVDYHEIRELQIVNPNDLLLERTAPTIGTPGINVLGEQIPATPGNEIPFSTECKGSTVSPTNSNQIIALIKGHPIRIAAGVNVDPTIQFNDIDLSTGNVNFDGAINITGDVHPGMKVRSTGDIFIKGHVNSSEIRAGGSIIILGGIHGKAQDNLDDENPEFDNVIVAGGNCQLKFVHNAEIKVEGNCNIDEYAYHCHMVVEGSLALGVPKGKGVILGGHIFAQKSVIANELGNRSEMITYVKAGNLPELNTQMNEVTKQLMSRKTELLRMTQILLEVKEHANDNIGLMTLNKNKKLVATFLKMKETVDELKRRKKELQERIQYTEHAHIIVKKMMYPNVTITINGVTEKYTTEVKKSVTLKRSGNMIVTE